MKSFLKHLTLYAILLSSFCLRASQPRTGYRGFIEWSNDYRTERFFNYENRESTYYTGISTSHGYQINPMFFVGAGLSVERCTKFDNWIVPVFAEGRADFKFGKFTPFADIRLGAQLADGCGVYFSPSIGYRIGLGRKAGVNLGLGMSLKGYKCEVYDITIIPGESFEMTYTGTEHRVCPYFSFRVGIDF